MMSCCCLLYVWLSLAVHQLLAQYHLLYLLLLISVTVLTAGLTRLIMRLSRLSDGAQVDSLKLSLGQEKNIIRRIGS